MNQKNIYGLHEISMSDFFHEIHHVQAETVLGGDTIVELSTVHDGINNLSNTFPSLVNVDNNKLFTFDFSRLTINWVIMLSEAEALILRWLI
ncbi:hypothetical protein NOS3756_43010 [Nostoc sp. NIES-3756]|uniref:hypothetical protein n=1 Tax=Nostoc sp. NIES-3756 TaxID=1751286 RepID=UPI00072050E8|nr:hypothetical protein [Nostoc sp. NIES-3756]BAT55322.1 hypothetical protein NOS3756_43010 [Nostoc sp. NIES-3756]